jgi:hypothetical protein
MNKPFTPLKVSVPVRSCPPEVRRVEETLRRRVGLSPASSSLSFEAFSRSLFQLLDSGVASVSDTHSGRPWPRPRIDRIRSLVEQYGTDVALAAAKEAREIVQSQDRAPNVTNLFAKKCADVAAERESIRDTVRREFA